MYGMIKNIFKVFIDDKIGWKYVKKVVDELMKNYKIDKELFLGIMLEVLGRWIVYFCFEL